MCVVKKKAISVFKVNLIVSLQQQLRAVDGHGRSDDISFTLTDQLKRNMQTSVDVAASSQILAVGQTASPVPQQLQSSLLFARSLLQGPTVAPSTSGSVSADQLSEMNLQALTLSALASTSSTAVTDSLQGNCNLPVEWDQAKLKKPVSISAVGSKARNRRGNYDCNFCGKVFPTWTGRYYHMPIHTGKWKHECMLCDKKFMRTDRYDQHIEKHRQELHQM